MTKRANHRRFGKLALLPMNGLIAYMMLLVGLSSLVQGSRDLDDPRAAPGWMLTSKSALFFVGGICIMGGLWRLRMRVELLGLLCLTLASLVMTVVSVTYGGDDAIRDLALFPGVAAACGKRFHDLLRGHFVAEISVQEESPDA